MKVVRRTSILAIRVLAFATVGMLALAVVPRLAGVWQCYLAASGGEHARAELVAKHAGLGLVFAVDSDPGQYRSCFAEAPAATLARARRGDVFDVVLKPDKPGECYLESGLRLSSVILWATTGLVLAVAALVFRVAGMLEPLVAGPAAAGRTTAAGEAS